MRQYKVANRYAKALFSLAAETNQLEVVNKDIELIQALDHDEFKRIILSPIISSDKKAALFEAVFGGRISKASFSLFISAISAFTFSAVANESAMVFSLSPNASRIGPHANFLRIKNTIKKARSVQKIKPNEGVSKSI